MQTPDYLLIIEWAGPVLLIASLTLRDPCTFECSTSPHPSCSWCST